jgi:hypothetical protein
MPPRDIAWSAMRLHRGCALQRKWSLQPIAAVGVAGEPSGPTAISFGEDSPMPSGIASLPYAQREQEPEAPLRLLARARFTTLRLDRRLARGASPDESPMLACRAGQLVDATARHTLAASIERLLALATDHPGRIVGPARVRFPTHHVLSNRALFDRLAELLRRPRPPIARGVAMTSVLLRDDASALYTNERPERLKEVLEAIVDLLE